MEGKNLTPEEKLEKFLYNIEEWVSGHHIAYASQKEFSKNEQVEKIINLDNSELRGYNVQECQETLLVLNQYFVYLNLVLSREKAAKAWADQGLNYLLAGKEFSPYTKWEEKKALILREGSVAAKLQELKTSCEARIMLVEAQMKNIEYILKIVESIWRSKSYERS